MSTTLETWNFQQLLILTFTKNTKMNVSLSQHYVLIHTYLDCEFFDDDDCIIQFYVSIVDKLNVYCGIIQ